jgi:hypothetical protein
MNIAILGAGNIAGALGKKWIEAGNNVVFGVRNRNSPKAVALKNYLADRAELSEIPQAIAAAEIVLFATSWAAVTEIAAANAAALPHKIIIDATNNFGGEVVSSIPTLTNQAPGAQVFRAFNALGWENFTNPVYGSVMVDLFYCGADSAGRENVEALIRQVGLRPVYLGGLEMLPVADALGSLWVTLAFRRGWGRGIALKLLER